MEWITVLKTKNTMEAEMCKMKLLENDIKAIIFDKKDSNYPVIGELEVKVMNQYLAQAKTIMNIIND
jgi:Putative prokaryotic signal transducing protein